MAGRPGPRARDTGGDHDVSIGDTNADFAAAMRDAEALVCDVSVVKAQFPCAAPKLKLLFITNAGLDKLAPFDWLPPGATLLNNRGTHAVKSGEFGIMAVLMLASRVPQMVTHQRAGRWQKLWGTVLAGKRLTIIGLGTLGGATATHAAHFGMHVTGVRAHPAPHPACAAGHRARRVGRGAAADRLPGARLPADRQHPQHHAPPAAWNACRAAPGW